MAVRLVLKNEFYEDGFSNEDQREEMLHKRLAAGATISSMSMFFKVPHKNIVTVSKRSKKKYKHLYSED